MPAYVVLSKFTQKGVANAKDIPERVKQNRSRMEAMGMRVIGLWFTLGEYDAVSVVEAPDDQTLAAAILASVAEGARTTQTLKAFSEDEFAQIVSKLP